MKIVIYGFGKNGREFVQDIKETTQGIEILAVSDTYAQEESLYSQAGVPYIRPSDIGALSFDYIVVTPVNYLGDIKRSLLTAGIEEGRIKSVKEFGDEFGAYCCGLCGSGVLAWRYTGEEHAIFHGKRIIGASRRRGNCPVCGSADRTRYVYSIIRKYTDLMDGSLHDVLHFAPEEMLSEKLRDSCGKGYVSADLMPGKADMAADITDMPFCAGRFDYIICNHVMEHVKAEELAFSEIKRCLKPTGILILTVPICWEQATYEDDGIVSEDDRIKYYGQKDHVRLYGNDIAERIEGFGFAVQLFRCRETAEEDMIARFGLIPEDSVLLCRKRL